MGERVCVDDYESVERPFLFESGGELLRPPARLIPRGYAPGYALLSQDGTTSIPFNMIQFARVTNGNQSQLDSSAWLQLRKYFFKTPLFRQAAVIRAEYHTAEAPVVYKPCPDAQVPPSLDKKHGERSEQEIYSMTSGPFSLNMGPSNLTVADPTYYFRAERMVTIVVDTARVVFWAKRTAGGMMDDKRRMEAAGWKFYEDEEEEDAVKEALRLLSPPQGPPKKKLKETSNSDLFDDEASSGEDVMANQGRKRRQERVLSTDEEIQVKADKEVLRDGLTTLCTLYVKTQAWYVNGRESKKTGRDKLHYHLGLSGSEGRVLGDTHIFMAQVRKATMLVAIGTMDELLVMTKVDNPEKTKPVVVRFCPIEVLQKMPILLADVEDESRTI